MDVDNLTDQELADGYYKALQEGDTDGAKWYANEALARGMIL